MTVVYDLLGVQSKEHGERGIARYVLNLALAIESCDPNLVDIYVVRDHLPAPGVLEPLIRTGKVRHARHLAEAPPRSGVYLVASPFELGESLDSILPNWARGPRWRRAGILYDLIPMIFPDHYLVDHWASIYRARAATVASLDHLFAISEATKRDGIRLLDRSPESITVIAAGAEAIFRPPVVPAEHIHRELIQRIPDLRPDYLLFPSGIEWRKNLDRTFDAYARLPVELRRQHQLVMVCRTNQAERSWLDEQTSQRGIADDFLATGFVTDDDLVRLYQAAYAVVFPSLYEGFGLPVLEARRCGAPVVCSDSSSLVEVQPDPAARFDPFDTDDVASVLRRLLSDPAERDRLRGNAVPPFTWEWAAERVIPTVQRLNRQAGLVERPKPRLAVVSPLPPQRSGIATYTYRLLEHVTDLADFTVFVDVDPAGVRAPEGVAVEHLDRMRAIEASEGQFDEVVYFLGNSQFHVRALRELRRRPGVVLLHDGRLTGLYQMAYELDRDQLPAGTVGTFLHEWYPFRYRDELAGRQVILVDEAERFGILLLREVASLATRVYTHSRFAAELVYLDTGQRAEIAFPLPHHHHPRTPPAHEVPTVTTFGMVDPIKQPFLLIDAFALVRQVHPTARLRFVGDVDTELDTKLRSAIERAGVVDAVELLGHVSDQTYEQAIAETTVAVQLRAFTNGESSAAVADLIGAGVPVVVPDLGALSELPDEIAVRVPPTVQSRELADRLVSLIEDSASRSAMVGAGLEYAATHSYQNAGRWLVDLLTTGAGTGHRPVARAG